MTQIDAFVGIDVAIAKNKQLPVSLCIRRKDRVIPLTLAESAAPKPPRGAGNIKVLDPAWVTEFAESTATYLRALEAYFKVSIRRIAIDAPSDPKQEASERRSSEKALDQRKISCFTTPSAREFQVIRSKADNHLRTGGLVSRLPHSNQLWMLAGFALFARLRSEWECLEVFPQATASKLGANSVHKRHTAGVTAQLVAAAKFTGWPDPPTIQALRTVVKGPAHDGLDAYLSAWVAALEPAERVALGVVPHDAIWVPNVNMLPKRAS